MNWIQSDGFFHPRLCRLWSGSGQNMVTVSRGVQGGFDKDEKDALALLLFDYAMVYSMKRDIPYVMKFMSTNKAL